MIFPFYSNDKKAYTINDANIGCNRVIVSDCDGWHKYASLCELIADCPSVKQLTKDCVIDFLNDMNNSSYNPSNIEPEKRFIRVWIDWCLEIADPCICNNEDKYVVVSKDDNQPWPLDTKVKWSCSYDGLYCIDIEEAWPQLLVWRPSGPNWPFLNPSLPSGICDADDWKWYIVRLRKDSDSWKVDYSCPEVDEYPQYCKCIYTGWKSATPWIIWSSDPNSRQWRTVRYFLPHANCTNKPQDSYDVAWSDSYILWDWNIKWTEAFARPNSYWVVRIVNPWIYIISYSTYIRCNQTLHSIRAWLYVQNSNWVLQELNDIKYQCWEYPGLSTLPSWLVSVDYPPLNRMFPDAYDKSTWAHYANTWWTLDNTWLPFSRTYILDVIKSTEIYMAIKPDMRDEDPRLVKANDSQSRYNIYVTWTDDQDEYWASTTIEITRVSNPVVESRLRDIRR